MFEYSGDPLLKHHGDRMNSLDTEKYEQIAKFYQLNPMQYQLNKIKCKRPVIEKGDIFIVNPVGNLYLYGIVLNANVSNFYGDDLYVICILKYTYNEYGTNSLPTKLKAKDILLGPKIVIKSYWTRGMFYNLNDKINDLSNLKYGFYRDTKRDCVDEYENPILEEVAILGRFAITTMTGIAKALHEELIIDNSFLSPDETILYNEFINNILNGAQ